MGLFSRARRELGFAYIRDIGRSYSPSAAVATHTVSSLCVHFGLPSATPEMLLLALRQDDGVRKRWTLSAAVEEEIEAAALEKWEPSPDENGWSTRAKGVIRSAWARTDARGSAQATRGDLLSGLAGAAGLPGRLLREAELDMTLFDAEEPAIDLGRLVAPADATDETPVWVVAVNDDSTPMAVVTRLLRECFGCPEPRATHLMLTTHLAGSALVCELPHAEARRRVERATEQARAGGAPFALRIVAPAG